MAQGEKGKEGKFAADSGRTELIWIGTTGSDRFETVAGALSHKLRRRILQLLAEGAFSVVNIAKRLDVPVTTVHFNVDVLEKAGLVSVIENSSARGKEHVVSRKTDRITFDLMMHTHSKTFTKVYSLPIGSYFEAKIKAPCGMASETGIIGEFDNPSTFLLGERANAQILWASGGTLEYRIPNDYLKEGASVRSIGISLELCSEISNYHNDWCSDITFWLNGVKLCTYTSPGDFGGRRGKLNPSWWSEGNTQYGLLTNITIKGNVVYLNEVGVASVKLDELHLERNNYFTLRLGVEDNAKNYGGFNLFGEKFGDYRQNIVISVDVDRPVPDFEI